MEKLAFTPQEYADLTGYSLRTVMEFIHRAHDPLPAIGRGGHGARFHIPAKLAAEWLDRQALRDTERRVAM